MARVNWDTSTGTPANASEFQHTPHTECGMCAKREKCNKAYKVLTCERYQYQNADDWWWDDDEKQV